MARIQRLDPLVINQIAAGEVVERPASVVKELIENSLDAGASIIRIKIEKGGKQLIEITDNGDGIFHDDLPLAIAQHATSKIIATEDLLAIASLGFRGEALASISSVSKFSLVSKPERQEQAYKIAVQGRESELTLLPESHPKGTTITVKELFFNLPARAKFLKTEKTETLLIEDIVRRMALSNPGTGFELMVDGAKRFHWPIARGDDRTAHRLARVLGKRFVAGAHAIDLESNGIRLYGYIGSPEYARSQNDQQYIFVNGRYVRDKLLHHALRQAYGDQIYQGRFPAFVLFIDMDPSEIDVNVHPTKIEVRFKDKRLVHDFLLSRIKDVLLNRQVHENRIENSSSVAPKADYYKSTGIQADPRVAHQNITPSVERHRVVRDGETLYIVDLVAFYRVYFKKRLLSCKQIETKPLVFPARVDANDRIFERLAAMKPVFDELGFVFDRLSETILLLRGVPAVGLDVDVDSFMKLLVVSIIDKTPTRDKVLELFLSQMRLTHKMQDDPRILNLIHADPSLPKIAIDLARFEVIA